VSDRKSQSQTQVIKTAVLFCSLTRYKAPNPQKLRQLLAAAAAMRHDIFAICSCQLSAGGERKNGESTHAQENKEIWEERGLGIGRKEL
jgi:hypothetical protein